MRAVLPRVSLRRLRPLALVSLLVLLGACGGHVYHVVERGETLYSIGWAYGYDYREVARWNGIEPPYRLTPGQRIRVTPGGEIPAQKKRERVAPVAPVRHAKAQDAPTLKRVEKPAAGPGAGRGDIPAPVVGPSHQAVEPVTKTTPADANNNTAASAPPGDVSRVVAAAKKLFGVKSSGWRWPTKQRRVLRTFSARDATRQGMDMAGNKGDPVYAAAAGQVVYAGSGLARYGQLIIVKHNQKYLSAYAHNSVLRVKEGERVEAGQHIADMGRSGVNNGVKGSANRAILHFEIRRNGKPVDPMKYLPKQ